MEKIKIKILVVIFLQSNFMSGIETEPDICGRGLLLKSGLINLKSTPPNIHVEVPKILKSGEKIVIKIKGLKDVSGLAVQAKSFEDTSIGKFSPNIKANQTNCVGDSNSLSIFRISKNETEAEISWEAPMMKEAINFRFHLTVIQSFSDFYSPFITDAIKIETENDNELDFVYDGCGILKLCFGMPDGCISSRNCQLLSTVRRVNQEFFEFEMLSNPQHNFIAFGISQSRSMADASVFECVHSGGSISAFASWNYAITNSRENVPQDFVRLREGRITDGRIYCRVERDTKTVVRGEIYNLETQTHFIQIAGGPFVLPNSVGAHFLFRHLSDEMVDLTNPEEVRGAGISALLLTHGSLMIIAWIGLTSIGILIAKYFKPMWHNKQIFGRDLWFVWHLSCMKLTWILTLVGFILIFVDLGTWRTTTHSVLGCVVFALASLQAVGGIMRPDPKAENRPVFNWMHQSLGNVIHLLAVLCIFFAVPLPAARLPNYTFYILIGFVSFYFLIHFIFMTVDIRGGIKKSKQEKQTQQVAKTPYSILKTCLLGIHVIVTLIAVIGLILIFTLEL